jgi:Pyridine nucleotide-disulphide oxidoreductase
MLPGKRPHVVIVGAGFGGLRCASQLKDEAVDVTLIDRNNYHLFQPLLYQVATAGLSPADIAFPIRALFRDNRAIRVLRGTVTGVDAARRAVMVDGREIGYDHLVLATGATHGYFGHEEWSANAPGLKHVEDAIAIRARVLSAFERAELATDPAERTRLLTFVICGAGRRESSSRAPSRTLRASVFHTNSAASIPHRPASCWCRRGRACCRPFLKASRSRRRLRWRRWGSRSVSTAGWKRSRRAA